MSCCNQTPDSMLSSGTTAMPTMRTTNGGRRRPRTDDRDTDDDLDGDEDKTWKWKRRRTRTKTSGEWEMMDDAIDDDRQQTAESTDESDEPRTSIRKYVKFGSCPRKTGGMGEQWEVAKQNRANLVCLSWFYLSAASPRSAGSINNK